MLYCPDCNKPTNHADLGKHLYQCLHCNLIHYKTARPYFDHQLAAAGEKRYEPEA